MFNRASGIVATLLSTVLAVYFFIPPPGSFAIANSEAMLSLLLFVATGLFIAIVIESLRTAYTEAADARHHAEQAARERDLLLAELSHRTKNDLARISATLSMQAVGASAETAAALQAAADRIKVLARVHGRLARRDGHVQVDMHDFLHDLVADLRVSLTNVSPIGLFIEAEHHSLPISRAGAVGLIANELITNALKHAFPDDREGEVRLGFWGAGDDLLLTVADSGVGMPESPAETGASQAQRSGGMGWRLVRALAAQLGGHLETTEASDAGGTLHILRFPIRSPGEQVTE
jgi:two-component sensor histidine kinase